MDIWVYTLISNRDNNMIKISYLFPFFILMLLGACINQDKSRTNRNVLQQVDKGTYNINREGGIEIKLNPYGKDYSYDELMDSVSFVKLETTDDNLVGEINDLFFVDDLIIVVDRRISKSIAVYDKTGKFLYKISQRGEGVDEYKYIDYVALTPDKKQLAVLIMCDKKIKYFSIDNKISQATHSFLMKTVNFPYDFSKMEFISDDVVLGYYSGGNIVPDNPDRQLFIVIGLDKNIKYAGYKCFYRTNVFSLGTAWPVRKFDSDVFLNPCFSDTIFKVNANGMEVQYVLNIKDGGNLQVNENTNNEEFGQQLDAVPYFNSHFVELKDAAVFQCMVPSPSKFTWSLYLKNENKTYDCNGKSKNRLFALFHLPFFKYRDNVVAVPVSPNRILGLKEALLQGDNKPQVEHLLDGLTEDDNPVIMFYHMKSKIQK